MVRYIKNAKLVLENGILWDGVLAIKDDRIIAYGSALEIYQLWYCSGIFDGIPPFVGIPGEPFTDIGVGIKETEGWL